MNEMIERMARAMWEDAENKPVMRAPKAHYLDMARAAIAAMREPTGEMKDAGARTYGDPNNPDLVGHPSEAWRAMIDAALAVPRSGGETIPSERAVDP